MGSHLSLNRSLRTARDGTPGDSENKPGVRILVLTGDPSRRVTITPGCSIDSLDDKDAYFFEDDDCLIGMIVKGGTVEYRAVDNTYVVRLCGAWLPTEQSMRSSSPVS